MKNILIILAFFILSSSMVSATTNARNATKIIKITELKKQVRSISDGIYTNYYKKKMRRPTALSPKPASVGKLIKKHFKTKVILNNISSSLENNLSNIEQATILRWLSSELGRKISSLESKPSKLKQSQQKALIHKIKTENPYRATLIRGLVDQSRATKINLSLSSYMSCIISVSIDSAFNAPSKIPFDQQLQRLEKSVPLYTRLDEHTYGSSLYIYKSLSINELNQYIDFLSSPTGYKFQKLIVEATLNEYIEASNRYIKALEKLDRTYASQAK